MEVYKSTARLVRERNDRVIAAAYHKFKKEHPEEKMTTVIYSLAVSGSLPYGSPAGIRLSLKRSKTI